MYHPPSFPKRKGHRLTAEEEQALARRWRESRDEAARDRIVTAHLDLVRGVLGRLKGGDLPRDDLFQDGVIGLMKAVEKFDPDEGVRFSTYATYWVRAEIQTSMRSGAGPVRVPRSHEATKVATWYHQVRTRLESDLAMGRRAPPADGLEREAARRMGVCPDQISTLLGRIKAIGLPIRTQAGDDETGDEGVLLFSDLTAEDLLAARERQALFVEALREACAALPDRDREIIERRYLCEDPETFQSIAERFGLTRERIRQIEARALRRIRKSLTSHHAVQGLISEGSK